MDNLVVAIVLTAAMEIAHGQAVGIKVTGRRVNQIATGEIYDLSAKVACAICTRFSTHLVVRRHTWDDSFVIRLTTADGYPVCGCFREGCIDLKSGLSRLGVVL